MNSNMTVDGSQIRYYDTSIFDQKVFRQNVELDACLTGMGGVCGNYFIILKFIRVKVI